jgi:hypothetical protein
MPTAQGQSATESKTLPPPAQTQTSAQRHVLRHISWWDRVCSLLPLGPLIAFRIDMTMFAYIVCGEVRSCYNRICAQSASKIRWGRGCPAGIDLGPALEPAQDGSWEPCKATHARSSCIECISAKYPWLSYGDAALILEGWELGREFGAGNIHTSHSSTVEP